MNNCLFQSLILDRDVNSYVETIASSLKKESLSTSVMRVLLAFAFFLVPCAYGEEPGVSSGLYFGNLDYEAAGDPDLELNNYAIKTAFHFSQGISVEVRAGKGNSDSVLMDSGDELEIEMDYFASVYVRDTRQITDWLSWYALLGYSYAKLEGTYTTATTSLELVEKESDWSYGMGLSFILMDRYSANIEWKQIVKGEDFELNGPSLGLEMKY